MRLCASFAVALLAAGAVQPNIHGAAPFPAGAVTLENTRIRYTVGGDGRNLSLVEKKSGRELIGETGASPCARLRKDGVLHDASGLAADGSKWTVEFSGADVEAVLEVKSAENWLEFRVDSVRGAGVDELFFLNIPLNTAGTLGEPAAACVLALNLQCDVDEIPGPSKYLGASCHARFGLEGAKAAIVAAPPSELREILKQVVSSAEELPHSTLGGPWAMDAPINYGSYLIDHAGELGEENAGEWAALAGNLGMGQIDLHPGASLRHGDLAPNPKNYPNGLDGVKAVVGKLHAAGIAVGLHTYAFYVAKDSEWVSPVPDKRLAVARGFTLAGGVGAEDSLLPVAESTEGVSPVTGFQVRNSATLRVDDELIVFESVRTDGGFAFAGCKRGAWGTTAASHAAGAKVAQLKECFGLFVPDPDTDLYAEVAARTAKVFNDCGFDMIYLDALDGSDIHAGGEYAWYYGSKFVYEIAKRLERPALFEMSTFTHHLWCVRSRMGAWDVPARAPKTFVDIHTRVNGDCALRFLPAHLGWWGAFDWAPVQPERTFTDDMEYVCGKCVGNDCGLSMLVGFSPEIWANSENARRLGSVVREYEELRLSGKTPEGVKELLRKPGAEYTLERDKDGRRSFRGVQYARHTVSGDGADEWTITNRFGRQEAGFRIEALMSAAPYDAPDGVVLAGFSKADEFPDRKARQGVEASLEPLSEPPIGAPDGVRTVAEYSAKSGHSGRESSWALAGKVFTPNMNLKDRALGLWVHGDGGGAVLNVQVKSPVYAAGGIGEHYVSIDFTGWRYCLLVEPESYDIARYGWPYSTRMENWGATVPMIEVITNYNIWADYGQIEQLNLWMNNLSSGAESRILLSPVHALPLRPVALKNPSVRVGGGEIVFPVALESGAWLEYRPGKGCTLYDKSGAVVREVAPEGVFPTLDPGENSLRFSCDTDPSGPPPRARVTVISTGDTFPVD